MSNSEPTDYLVYHRHLRERLGQLRDELCGPAAGFARLHREALADGAVSHKTKELMALAIGIALRCEGCIAFHMHDAIEAGARREEILDTIGVAWLMAGGPGSVYAAHALDALEQLLPATPDEEGPTVPEVDCEGNRP